MSDSAICRRMLESRLEARESQLQIAAAQSGCGTWTLEPDTGELHCSARALCLLGLPADAQPTFDGLLALVRADDRVRLSSTIAHALAVRDQFEVEFTLNRDGARDRLLRCRGRAHSSALNPERHALSGILLPVAHDADGLITLDAERLAAMILRLEGMCGLERSTLVTRLQAELLPRVSDLQQHMAMLASDSTLAPEQRAQVDAMLATASTWLDTLRAVIFDCQPPGASELGFCGAVERHARDTAAGAGLALGLSLPAEPLPLPDPALRALYEAACAGMDNVAIHAHALRMDVSVRCDRTNVIVEISDDGDGIQRADLRREGALGLFAASARLKTCDGVLRVRNRPEGGTLLQISVPFDPASEPDDCVGVPGHAA